VRNVAGSLASYVLACGRSKTGANCAASESTKHAQQRRSVRRTIVEALAMPKGVGFVGHDLRPCLGLQQRHCVVRN